jgi:predicted GH43/DUF377 family glycosyl hydrolase
LFSTAGIVRGKELIIGYGAADEVVGVCRVDFGGVVQYVRRFDADGTKSMIL